MLRRTFMKICSLAIASPKLLMPKKEDKYTDDLELVLSFPSAIYNSETGKARILDTSNPSDAVLYMIFESMGNGNNIEYDRNAFDGWKYYCIKNHLKCAIITKGRSLLSCLCEAASKGQAFLYWDGEKGLRVIYGTAEQGVNERYTNN